MASLDHLGLDHASPVPLYHQLAEAIRYRIATGALGAGSILPALRRAAHLWGVNLHTVRRAYGELEGQGLVATRGTTGTQVLPAGDGPTPRPSARERFLSRVLMEAREKHGLDAAQLAALLGARRLVAGSGQARIFVVECSRTQCEDMAAQIEGRWLAAAVPWPLERTEAPPPGVVLATYFHYNDIRLRWPGRFDQVRFAAIRPDPELGRRLRSRDPRARARRLPVVLCEQEPVMLRNIAADLSRVLPEKEFQVTTEVVDRPEAWLARRRTRVPVLFAPRLWGRLSETARSDPRVHEVRYVFDPKDLEALGRDLGWQERGEPAA